MGGRKTADLLKEKQKPCFVLYETPFFPLCCGSWKKKVSACKISNGDHLASVGKQTYLKSDRENKKIKWEEFNVIKQLHQFT